jgi:hypothetical protein
MKIGNEHPIGLATVLGFLPFVVAGIVFVVLLIRNGGDVQQAQALTLAIVMGVSSVGTAALRQWRAVNGGTAAPAPAPVTEPAQVTDAMPAPDEEIDLGKAA